MAQLIHKKTKQVLATNVIKTQSFLLRLKGLMGQKSLPLSHTLWIIPCQRGVHTFFMRFPLDLIFVDRDLKITDLYQNIPPWRRVLPLGSFALIPSSYSVFEFQSPALKPYNLQTGDMLYVGH